MCIETGHTFSLTSTYKNRTIQKEGSIEQVGVDARQPPRLACLLSRVTALRSRQRRAVEQGYTMASIAVEKCLGGW